MQVARIGQAIDRGIAQQIFIQGRRSRQSVTSRIIRPLFWIAAFLRLAGAVIAIWPKRVLMLMVVAAVVLSAGGGNLLLAQVAQEVPEATQSAPLTPEALQRLVAPIALYPDALVAQILAASTYPSEIVEADRWLENQSNPNDEKLAEQVDKQSWDPSVKALTDFPSVLANLDTNLSWTSALGDAYFNQQQDVLDAVQVLRGRAKEAGNLETTPQQTVTDQGSTIVIQPADPDVCYVPTYNPLLVYGNPIGIYPGYLYNSLIGAPDVSFGLGIGIGGRFRRGFGWGFHSWDCNWIGHSISFNHNIYVSHSPTFFHRFPGDRDGNFGRGPGRPSFPGNHPPGDSDRNRGGGTFDRNRNQGMSNINPNNNRGGDTFGRNRNQAIPNPNSDRNLGGGLPHRNFDRNRNQGIPNPNFDRNRGGAGLTPGAQGSHDFRGFGQPGPNTGTRSGAFSGIGQGGIERGSAARGQSSLGGSGGPGGGRGVGGGAGMRGGGGGRGGGQGGGRH